MSIVEHAVIAAAGLGSRLGQGKPKCLVDMNGYPIIKYQLSLLKDVPDVRVVIGFEEHEVIETVTKIRSDVTFIRNPAFRTTTTLFSYALGAKHIDSPCLFMDGDIIFQPDSFQAFIEQCTRDSFLVGVTEAKTEDAVFVRLDDNEKLLGFSREESSAYEWANIVWVPPDYFQCENRAVFESLSEELPLPISKIISYEVDTAEDYKLASQHAFSLADYTS